jgi:hypothetical protein
LLNEFFNGLARTVSSGFREKLRKFKAENVFIMDETRLFYRALPTRTAHCLLPSVCCCVDRTAGGPGKERRTWSAALLHVVHLTGCRVLSFRAVICSGSFVNHWRLVGVRNGFHRAEKTSVAPQHASACKFDPVGAITAYAD